jgi:hypothetical protein
MRKLLLFITIVLGYSCERDLVKNCYEVTNMYKTKSYTVGATIYDTLTVWNTRADKEVICDITDKEKEKMLRDRITIITYGNDSTVYSSASAELIPNK